MFHTRTSYAHKSLLKFEHWFSNWIIIRLSPVTFLSYHQKPIILFLCREQFEFTLFVFGLRCGGTKPNLSVTGSEITYSGLELYFLQSSYVVVSAQTVLSPTIFLNDSFKAFLSWHGDNYLLPNRSVVREATPEMGHLVLGILLPEIQQNHVLSTRLVSYWKLSLPHPLTLVSTTVEWPVSKSCPRAYSQNNLLHTGDLT